ncbi:Serine hydroxymethyltransferase 7 [Hibiscus syriacus]|uniref:Serine hydroxymethyltransferase n=1 Tax=Hibiscus syriacus TaxID=106335 RepID=A0A6A2ZLA5_HIBSY|nr:Serine hydroxymethyltransferase 7 [Hibiscus syriacus]
MCVKRQRDPIPGLSLCKRFAPDPGLDQRLTVVRTWGNQRLEEADPELSEIMDKERQRQYLGIELIASENYVCRSVMEAVGSHLTNKYSEGMPGVRYYTGNHYIDQIETLCQERALAAFDLYSQKWGVNVQPYSWHMSHGCYIPSGKKVSAASIFFESFPYKVNPEIGFIDYNKIEEKVLDYQPKILICGGSSYPREWDYARFRQIADRCGAVLMCDMAHIGGLVAAKECASPFDFCDIVTSTTHKSLRGPRGALKQVATPEFKAYIQQVKKNAQALASALLRKHCKLVTGGTDNHLLLWDLSTLGIIGKCYEKVCEMCHITLNKTAIFGDNGVISPGGVRIGTPTMTSRGCLEFYFEIIADFLYTAAEITSSVQRDHGKSQKEFIKGLNINKDVIDLRIRVETFAAQFAMPGYDS